MYIVSDISSYELEIEERADWDYGADALCSDWNSEYLAIGEQLEMHRAATVPCNSDGMPAMLADRDLDTFLEQMYWHQE